MKVLLRNARTGCYSAPEGGWVGEAEAARDFGTVQAAGEKAKQLEPEPVRIVLRYESPDCELALDPAQCF